MADKSLGKAVRKQLTQLLEGGQAHATFEDAAKGLPAKLQGVVPEGLPYSAWQIVEHIRIAQRDILDFSRNSDGKYQPRKWPDDYWPKSAAPPTKTSWDKCLQQIVDDRKAFEALLKKADDADLVQPLAWGNGQNLLREALLIADHSAYHTGELIVLRRLLGGWKK